MLRWYSLAKVVECYCTRNAMDFTSRTGLIRTCFRCRPRSRYIQPSPSLSLSPKIRTTNIAALNLSPGFPGYAYFSSTPPKRAKTKSFKRIGISEQPTAQARGLTFTVLTPDPGRVVGHWYYNLLVLDTDIAFLLETSWGHRVSTQSSDSFSALAAGFHLFYHSWVRYVVGPGQWFHAESPGTYPSRLAGFYATSQHSSSFCSLPRCRGGSNTLSWRK